jgi:hypothetical protein
MLVYKFLDLLNDNRVNNGLLNLQKLRERKKQGTERAAVYGAVVVSELEVLRLCIRNKLF